MHLEGTKGGTFMGKMAFFGGRKAFLVKSSFFLEILAFLKALSKILKNLVTYFAKIDPLTPTQNIYETPSLPLCFCPGSV